MTNPFAHFEGEDPAQTAAHVAALQLELEGRRARGDDETDVLVELARFGVAEKSKRTAARGETRLRGAAAEKRSS